MYDRLTVVTQKHYCLNELLKIDSCNLLPQLMKDRINLLLAEVFILKNLSEF